MTNKVAVRTYMHQVVEDHRDSYTDEINATALAEEAALVFDLYGPEPDCEIPEWVYEYAADVASQHEGGQP